MLRVSVFDGSMRQWRECQQKLSVMQYTISNRKRQHLSCIVSMVTDSPIGHIYCEDSLSAREIQRYRNKSFGIIRSVSVSVPILYLVFRYLKVPAVVPKYRNTEFYSVFPALLVSGYERSAKREAKFFLI